VSAETELRGLLARNLASARRVAERLRRSREKLASDIPLSAEAVTRLTEAQQEAIDALLKRYEQLEDALGRGLFRTLAALEGEDVSALSRRDLALLMEKLGVVASAEAWNEAALMRNRLVHHYPDEPDRQAERINAAWRLAEVLLETLARLEAHVRAKGFLSG